MLDFSCYQTITPQLRSALDRYINDGLEPGGFLTAVLANDLVGAIGRADSHSLRCLPELVRFIYNEIPAKAWGNYRAVDLYVEQFNQIAA